MTTERRLDDVVAALGRARPRLDEITRARVASRVEAALRDQPVAETPAAPAPARRRWPRKAALAAVGIAGLAAGTAALLGGATSAPAPVVSDEAPVETVVADGPAQIDVAAGESEHVSLGETAITVYGPGRLDGDAERATVHAAAIVVDRPHESAPPWSLRYDDITVVASRATFAVDRGTSVRVTVMRGEVLLLCEDGAHPVSAGDSAECPRPRASAPARSAAASIGATAKATDPVVAPPEEPAPPARPEPRPARPLSVAAAEPPAPVPVVPVPAPAPLPPPPAEPVPDEAFELAEPIASAAQPNVYKMAEHAMRRGDREGARAALNAVIAADPTSVDSASALLDLAMLAHREGNDARAHTYLDRLDRHVHRASLVAPAGRLRAQLDPP